MMASSVLWIECVGEEKVSVDREWFLDRSDYARSILEHFPDVYQAATTAAATGKKQEGTDALMIECPLPARDVSLYCDFAQGLPDIHNKCSNTRHLLETVTVASFCAIVDFFQMRLDDSHVRGDISLVFSAVAPVGSYVRFVAEYTNDVGAMLWWLRENCKEQGSPHEHHHLSALV